MSYYEFFNNAGSRVSAPVQVLRLMVDNNLPHVDIVNITHGASSVAACAIEHMTSNSDGIRFKITVEDAEQHLRSFYLNAHYGDGGFAPIYSDSYPAHRSASHKWKGVKNLVVPAGVWVPPITCAYQFRLTAYPRVTNGYNYIWNHNTDTRHVTLIKPAGVMAVPSPLFTHELPLGLAEKDRLLEEGEEPEKLGDETVIVAE